MDLLASALTHNMYVEQFQSDVLDHFVGNPELTAVQLIPPYWFQQPRRFCLVIIFNFYSPAFIPLQINFHNKMLCLAYRVSACEPYYSILFISWLIPFTVRVMGLSTFKAFGKVFKLFIACRRLA